MVESKHEVLRILEEGSLRRTTAATKMNASSSRSHTVFTITVTITEKSIVGQGRRDSTEIFIRNTAPKIQHKPDTRKH